MRWLRRAGVDVLAISWWGRNGADRVDRLVRPILDAAHRRGLRACIMRDGRHQDPSQFEAEVRYFAESYFGHPAYWHVDGAPVVWQWRKTRDGQDFAWRETYARLRLDLGVLLMVNAPPNRPGLVSEWRVDGLYTWGTIGESLDDLSRYASFVRSVRDQGGLSCLAAIPGFDNRRRMEDPELVKHLPRLAGATYDRAWEECRAAGPDMINVPWNVWPEAMVIEPAKPRDGYDDYRGHFGRRRGRGQFAYVDRTREHAAAWKAS